MLIFNYFSGAAVAGLDVAAGHCVAGPRGGMRSGSHLNWGPQLDQAQCLL
jgi:hypothetical protein